METPKPPPQRVMLSMAARHVRTKHHMDVTRQTIYNWAKTGVGGVKLRVIQTGNRKYTTKEWVDEFLNHLASVRAS